MIKVRNESGEYPCYICPAVLDSKKNLRLHSISNHKDEESLRCPKCDLVLKDISSVRRHLKTVHYNLKEYACGYCDKRYAHKYDLEKHFISKHKTSKDQDFCGKMCPSCNVIFRSDEALTKHMSEKHNKTIKNLKCPYCIKVFFDSVYLKQHLSRVHANRAFDSSSAIYICCHCQFCSEDIVSMTNHLALSHNWGSVFFCRRPGCGDYFKTEEDMEAHSISHPPTISKLPRVRKIRNTHLSYRCYDCDFISNDKVAMITHLTDVHHSFSVFECQWCSSFFSTESDLEFHKPCPFKHGDNPGSVSETRIIEEELCEDDTPVHNPKRPKIIPFMTYRDEDDTYDRVYEGPGPSGVGDSMQ